MSDVPFKAVADFNDVCGEGPLWDALRGCLYWTDIGGKRLHSFDWQAKQAETVLEGFEIASFALDESGHFVIANGEGFWHWNGQSQPVRIGDSEDLHARSLNDGIADPAGGMIAASCYFQSDAKNYPRGSLIRLDQDGRIAILDEGFLLANGLGFSPDESTLYFADSGARTIFAYDLQLEPFGLSNKRVFVQVPLSEGIPDGLTVDAEGYVWSAQWFGSGLVRYDPDGKVERRVAVPAKQSSSLTFGGPELSDIFVTSAAYSDALPLAPKGYDPNEGYVGGKLFHANLGIRGKAEYRCKIG